MLSSLKNRGKGNAFFLIDKRFASENKFYFSCFSELLVDNSFQEKEKKTFATTIKHSSGLLMNLINDVLDLSRLESGNYSFTIKEWDIVVLCREVAAFMDNKARSSVKLNCVFL